MGKCIYDLKRHFNELNEEEVFCRWYSRWMNCALGDCSANCEQYCENHCYLVRLYDKKEFWSIAAGRFISPYMKYPLTVFGSFEEAKEFAMLNSKGRKRPLLVCDINGKIIKE